MPQYTVLAQHMRSIPPLYTRRACSSETAAGLHLVLDPVIGLIKQLRIGHALRADHDILNIRNLHEGVH